LLGVEGFFLLSFFKRGIIKRGNFSFFLSFKKIRKNKLIFNVLKEKKRKEKKRNYLLKNILSKKNQKNKINKIILLKIALIVNNLYISTILWL